MLSVFFKTACIFLICIAGYVLRRRGTIDSVFNRQLSLLQINVVYPALIIHSLTSNFTWQKLLANWALPTGVAMIMLVGWLAGLVSLPLLRRESPATRGMFQFQCTINNYSFLPIMLAATMFTNSQEVIAQIVFGAIGAELVVWTIGIRAITAHLAESSDSATSPLARLVQRLRGQLRNLISMPLLAMALGAAWLLLRHKLGSQMDAIQNHAVGRDIATMFSTALKMTGDATIPIAGIIVGARMSEIKADHVFTRPIVLATILRLAVIPAAATGLLLWLPFPRAILPPLLIVAAQPCAMASVMMGEAYHSDARFAAATVFTTHLACLITIPLWLSAPWFG